MPPNALKMIGHLKCSAFAHVVVRPFFLPQLRRLPAAVVPVVYALERTGPLAHLAARRYGRLFCAAWA